MNNEREQLIEQLKELRAQLTEVMQEADDILGEDDHRRRWTPIIIKGGLAGAAVTWIVGLIRGALREYPVASATASIVTSGAILGTMLAPAHDDASRQVGPPPRPPSEGPPAPSSTSSLPPLTTARPTRGSPPLTAALPASDASGPATAPTPAPTTTTSPPDSSNTGSPPTAPGDGPPDTPATDCVIRVDALDLVDLCLIPHADRLRASSA